MADVEKANRLVTELVAALGFTEADVFSITLTPKEAVVDHLYVEGTLPDWFGSQCRPHQSTTVRLRFLDVP